ncbi:hypothetical protein LX97_01699 [Nonlabens dokdonensis]|jgi:hypothetical protein|uniref:Uncharacterized protein n=2 Tax=Nonlabens dokdonensis TaxID=328515 RepID=L7W6U6_NONDD|nr:hypothetical protein [Nonlabens dokdonensis]AGC77400.1 hypothetical protein DDD_2273 [Nonlabens dokdonensis DSW-6]PZX40926.1 hypothetical protein LX97_01699 [Nonlabens dokdonensis]
MLKLIHIINPVKIGETSDLFIAQPITFESMRIAKEFASHEVDVELLTAHFSEDREIIPDYFTPTKDLHRSVLDLKEFKVRRKLPLIKDILERAVNYSDNSEYIVYTNVDIALMPHFYLFVKQQIQLGYDSFVINRRTITKQYSKLDQIPLMYAEVGHNHPGFDCFVFKKNLYNKFILNDVCIGVSKIGVTLLSNLLCFSNNFRLFHDKALTFHIGEDKVWQNKILQDYYNFNCDEALKSMTELLLIKPSLSENPIFEKHFSLLKNPNKDFKTKITIKQRIKKSLVYKVTNKILRFGT